MVIHKVGKPVAVLVDARLFARIRRMLARIEAGFAGTPEAEGMAEIEAAVREARRAGAEGQIE
jgi:hypothetical protein